MKDEFGFFESSESEVVQRVKAERINRPQKSYKDYLAEEYGPLKAKRMTTRATYLDLKKL